jgi:hypothetical protein
LLLSEEQKAEKVKDHPEYALARQGSQPTNQSDEVPRPQICDFTVKNTLKNNVKDESKSMKCC